MFLGESAGHRLARRQTWLEAPFRA